MPCSRLFAKKIVLAGVVLAIASCTDNSGPPPQPVVTPVDATTAATLTVQITFKGQAPDPIEVNMRASRGCSQQHDEPVYVRQVENDGGTLANALVYIKSGLEGRVFHYPTEPLIIDQRGCMYEPRIAGLMVGQELRFLNSDPEAHNVRGRPREVDSWNFMISRKNASRSLRFDKPEIGIRVGCDVHPWMSAYVSVLTHPYFGISDKQGQVQLKNLPPGEYTAAAWHETLGEKEVELNIKAKENKRIEIAF